MDRIVEEWAEAQGLEIECWMGSGDFGHAFETTCGQIVKITRDPCEFMAAFSLQGQTSDFLVDIHKAELTDDDDLLILMEKVDTEGVEDVFSEAMNLVEEFAFGEWTYFDPDELPDDYSASEEALQLIDHIAGSILHLQQKGIDRPDVSPDNIGVKNGRFVLFDFQMTEDRLHEEFKAYIRQEQAKRNQASRPSIRQLPSLEMS